MTSGIKVLFIGEGTRKWSFPEYQVEICSKVNQLMIHLGTFRPDVVVTSEFIPGELNLAAFDVRRKWIHVSIKASAEEVSKAIESCYASGIWGEHPYASTNPLVTVYTGTYNTGTFLRDCYQALREQTYPNWEWSVVDDGSTDGTWERLLEIAKEDFRVNPVRINHSGKIGRVKGVATMLAKGKYLIELDHDDMLTDTAVEEVKKAFESDPEIGFVYTNCASFFQNGAPQMFNDEFWKPRYRDFTYRGKTYKECVNPDINDRFGPHFAQQFGWFLTVGPNHIRAYRADKLREFGGYNHNIPVADDWEVYARFFLRSKCFHLDKCLYLYRFLDGYSNTTFTRNKSIQDHLALGRNHYAKEFDEFNKKRLAVAPPPEEKKAEGLSVVILDWNTKDRTLACIDSVRKNYPEAEIVLVQNGEPFECKQANQVIPLEINVGYAAGVNRGVMAATKGHVCLLNSDTLVEPGLFEKLIAPLSPSIGITAPYCSNARPPQGNYPKENCPKEDRDIPVVFVCVMMERKVFNSLGGLDPRLTTFEDDDFCLRLKKKGLGYRIVGGTWIEHHDHQSFKANELDVNAIMRENQTKFHKKWPRIKVIALAKDEKEALPGFFDQFRSVTSQFAILDSGSTDGTLEWAKANGIQVATRDFDRFDSQRNASIEMLGQDAEWIIQLDPDERLDAHTIQCIPELVRSEEFDIYLTHIFAKHPDGSEREWIGKPFLWRNKPEIRWALPVHEKLIGSLRQAWIKNGRIDHVIALHKPDRRAKSEGFYANLAKLPRQDVSLWPIIDYEHPMHPGLKQISIGPLVSIVIPTCNRFELRSKAEDSIRAQDYRPFEAIIVGDGPGSIGGITGLQGEGVDLFRYYTLPKNHGAGGAVPRNYAIMLSSSSWIAYLDDDNQWEPEHLSSLMAAAEKNGAAFAISSMKVLGKERICDKPEFGKVDSSCVMHQKDLVRVYGWWKDRLEGGYAHDFEFVSRWVKDEKWAASLKATCLYNAETSGQFDFLKKLVGA